MAKTLIAGSALASAVTGPSFTISTAKALVHCSAGEISLQIEITTGVWADMVVIDDDIARPVRIPSGNAMIFDVPDTASNYRLIGHNGRSTGTVYTLT